MMSKEFAAPIAMWVTLNPNGVDEVPTAVAEVKTWEPRETMLVDGMELALGALEGWNDKEHEEKERATPSELVRGVKHGVAYGCSLD